MNSKELAEKLRDEYTQKPPEGMTADLVRHMSDSDLLDMDYFLHEDVFGELDDEDGFPLF